MHKSVIYLLIGAWLLLVVIWTYYTIRSICFQKRIRHHVTVKEDYENLSFIDRSIHYLNQKLDKIVGDLTKKGNQYPEEENKNKKIRLWVICFVISIFFLILYILLALLRLCTLNFLGILFLIILACILPDMILEIEKKSRLKQIEKELLKAVTLINKSLQSGKSMIQAVKTVSTELEGPISYEFNKIYEDMMHGLSFEVSFNRFYQRTNLEEVRYITSILGILNRTGGNIVSVFSAIEKSFYTRRKLDFELKATIASSKLVFQLLVALPIFFAVLLTLWNPDYFSMFFTSTLGSLLLMMILIIYILYILIIYRIMKIEKY